MEATSSGRASDAAIHPSVQRISRVAPPQLTRSGSVESGSVESEQCGPLGQQANTLGRGDRSKPGTAPVEESDESGDGTHQP